MQACQHGHWEVVQTLIIFNANVWSLLTTIFVVYFDSNQINSWVVKHCLLNWIALQIHKADYLNGGTALHLAALNGHTRCIRLILADYIPSVPNFWNALQTGDHKSISEFDQRYSVCHSKVLLHSSAVAMC